MKQFLFTISVFVLLTACGSSDNIEIVPTINGFETGFIFDDADDFVGDSITEEGPDNSFEFFLASFPQNNPEEIISPPDWIIGTWNEKNSGDNFSTLIFTHNSLIQEFGDVGDDPSIIYTFGETYKSQFYTVTEIIEDNTYIISILLNYTIPETRTIEYSRQSENQISEKGFMYVKQ